LHPIIFQALLRPQTASFNPQGHLLHRTIDDHRRLCRMTLAAQGQKDLNLFVRPPTSSQGDQVLSVYRASISRTVGLVVAPREAASARGQDAPQLRVGKPRNDAKPDDKPSAPASGSVIPPIERRGGLSPVLPVDSRAIGKLARAVPRTHTVVIVNAQAAPFERNRKVE
jgi:hypothetical protein